VRHFIAALRLARDRARRARMEIELGSNTGARGRFAEHWGCFRRLRATEPLWWAGEPFPLKFAQSDEPQSTPRTASAVIRERAQRQH